MTAVIFKFQKPDGAPVVGAPFTVALRKPSFDEALDDGILLPGTVEGVTDTQGECTLVLAPGYGAYYLSMLIPGEQETPEGCMPGFHYKFSVPDSTEVLRIEDLIVTTPTWSRPWDEQALAIIVDAKAKSQAAADAAQGSAQAASSSATQANGSAVAAFQDAERAAVSASDALAHKNAAAGSANMAGTAAVSAVNARDAAQGHAATTAGAASAAGNSATAAQQSATQASASAQSASTSVTTATNAKDAASLSAQQALTSKNSSETAAGTATTKAAEALTSANNSASSASTALTQANRAKTEADRATAATDGKQDKNDNLTAFSGLVGATDRLPYFTGAGALSLAVLTAKARLLLARADTAGMQAELGLVPVVNEDDSTSQRILKVGYKGIGTPGIPLSDWGTAFLSGCGWSYGNAGYPGGTGESINAVVMNMMLNTGPIGAQIMAYCGDNQLKFRTAYNGFGPWNGVFHTGNAMRDPGLADNPGLMFYGANANGEFWKYACGMLVCKVRRTFNIALTSQSNGVFAANCPEWAFPVSFVGDLPMITQNTGIPGYATIEGANIPSNGFVQGSIYSMAAIPSSLCYQGLMAVGRWK